jgi:hypothetical protein
VQHLQSCIYRIRAKVLLTILTKFLFRQYCQCSPVAFLQDVMTTPSVKEGLEELLLGLVYEGFKAKVSSRSGLQQQNGGA